MDRASTARATPSATSIERRYLESVKYVKNAAADAERRKLQAVIDLFRKYGAQYDLDYLLMAAQGYQESTLDQNVKSPVGAIGVMQVMPPTGKELKVGDITKLEPNIHAGVKYMRFMMDQYFKDEPMDDLNKGLMTFASYNAGPGRVRQLRREAEKRGLDPNVWFGNVERVASERIGRETVTYVSNIYKYYIAYRLISEQRAASRSGEDGGRAAQVNVVADRPPPEPAPRERTRALAIFTALLAVAALLAPLWAAEPERVAGLFLLAGAAAEIFQGFRRRTSLRNGAPGRAPRTHCSSDCCC